MKKISLILLLSCICSLANASQTWIVIGDSIMSSVAQGTASQHALHLVAAERDVIFKNIASPGASLGSTDTTGFNSSYTDSAISQIGGMYSWYNGVLIQAGTNDFGRNVSVAETISSMRRILTKVQADDRKALVLDPIYRDGENIPNSLNEAACGVNGNTLNCYRYFIAYVCEQEFSAICKFAARGDTVMGSLTNNYDSTEVAQNKRLHPNPTGHRKLADWIKAKGAAVGYF